VGEFDVRLVDKLGLQKKHRAVDCGKGRYAAQRVAGKGEVYRPVITAAARNFKVQRGLGR